MKNKNKEWNTQLSDKHADLRDQKKTWMTQATTLETAKADLEVCLSACISECYHIELFYSIGASGSSGKSFSGR